MARKEEERGRGKGEKDGRVRDIKKSRREEKRGGREDKIREKKQRGVS